jgi:phenylalanyl-tRNA synthetase beta subunit
MSTTQHLKRMVLLADVEQEAKGIAIAYTMGGAKLAIQNNSMDNVGGTANSNDEITEVSLSLAF